MQVTTVPASRFGWQGQTVEYVVTADGANEIAAPSECPDGVRVRVLDTQPTDTGVKARVAVDVSEGALY